MNVRQLQNDQFCHTRGRLRVALGSACVHAEAVRIWGILLCCPVVLVFFGTTTLDRACPTA